MKKLETVREIVGSIAALYDSPAYVMFTAPQALTTLTEHEQDVAALVEALRDVLDESDEIRGLANWWVTKARTALRPFEEDK